MHCEQGWPNTDGDTVCALLKECWSGHGLSRDVSLGDPKDLGCSIM